MLCRATQDGWVMVESSDKMWSTEEGNDKPLQYSCLENSMNSMERQKDSTLKDELPRSVAIQYATGNSLDKTLMLGHILKAGREGDDKGCDVWMASLTEWT